MRASVPTGDTYGVNLYRDSENCADPRRIGSGDSVSHPVSTQIPANMLTTVEFFFLKPNRQQCAIRYTFTPLVGKTYLLRGSALEKGCRSKMLDASVPDDLKPAPAVLWRNAGTANCLPLSQSRAISVQDLAGELSGGDAVLRQGASADDLRGLIQK